jgi:hypothetical protein
MGTRSRRTTSSDTPAAEQAGQGTAGQGNAARAAAFGASVGERVSTLLAAAQEAAGPSTDDILRDYQVADDEMVEWSPNYVGWPTNRLGITRPRAMTQTEADLPDELQHRRGLVGLNDFKSTVDDAYGVSDELFAETDDAGLNGAEDGHEDAFRHIYWNVLMSRRLGEGFAESFGTAHEGVPGNPADREAMDLFNNELGRRIARDNPRASDEELQQLVMQAIRNGEAVVIDRNGELVFSDQTAPGTTGLADDAPANGVLTPPEWTGSL